jgi:hypothetical protein
MMMQIMLMGMMRCAAAVRGRLVNTATACIAVDTIDVQEQQQPEAAGPALPVLAVPLYETSPSVVGLLSAIRMA